jgi:hypothetical protein
MTCHKCGRELNEKTETVWNMVVGWEKRREAGGTNHIALRRRKDLYCCNGCMTLMLDGLSPAQEAMRL